MKKLLLVILLYSASIFAFAENLNLAVVAGQQSVTVSFEQSESQIVMVYVYNMLGKVIVAERINAVNGENHLELSTTDMVKGAYIAKIITSKGETKAIRFNY